MVNMVNIVQLPAYMSSSIVSMLMLASSLKHQPFIQPHRAFWKIIIGFLAESQMRDRYLPHVRLFNLKLQGAADYFSLALRQETGRNS